MTREPFIAHSELTNEIYIVTGKEKYRVTEQAIKAVMAIKALEQEPFDIETYCKEHFCVMVDKDVWEKAEKALEQETYNDAISRKEVLNQIFYSTDNSGDVVLGSVLRRRIENLPSVRPQEPKTGHRILADDELYDIFSRIIDDIYRGD